MILDDFLPDKRVEREARAIANAGHDVSLFHFEANGFKSITEVDHYPHKPSFVQKKLKAIAVEYPWYHLSLKSAVLKFLEETKPDIIHIHDMTIAGLIYRLRRKERIVLDLHENRPEIMRYYPHLKRFPGNLLIKLSKWRKAEQEYVKRADHLILVTEEAQEDYQHLNEKIAIVPNVVEKLEIDNVTFDSSILSKFNDGFNVVYVGDLGSRRGIFTALEAMLLIKDKIASLQLILVGDSSEADEYKKFVRDNELTDLVSFEGYQAHEKLYSYIKVAHVGISPLLRNKHHDTTYANKIFQYMAMGKSQIVSDCLAQKVLIEKTNVGIVHEAGDAVQLADAILKLFRDQRLRGEMDAKAEKAFRNEFNWENKQSQLVELYDSFD